MYTTAYTTYAQVWVQKKLVHALILYSERKFLTYITGMFKKVDFTHPCVSITKNHFCDLLARGHSLDKRTGVFPKTPIPNANSTHLLKWTKNIQN